MQILNKRKLEQIFEATKDGLAFYFAVSLILHSILPIQVMAAEPTSATGTEQVLIANPEAQPAAEPEPPKAPPTVQEVLLEVCTDRGYGEDCAKHLLGMLWKESNNIAKAIGDRGKARGYFQIHYKMHKVPVTCAEDLRCSADWTIDYLEKNSYPKYVAYAIQCHNGCNIDNGYAASALRHGKRLWKSPLAINAGAPEPDFKMAVVKK